MADNPYLKPMAADALLLRKPLIEPPDMDDEDDDDPIEDAVPTERMPIPLTVPLPEDLAMPKRRSNFWAWALAAVALGFAASVGLSHLGVW